MKSVAALSVAAIAVASAKEVNLDGPAIDHNIIAQVNSDPTSTWTAGTNSKFEGMTLRQAMRLMGSKAFTPEGEARRATRYFKDIKPAAAIPASFNSTSNWPDCTSTIGHIRDQSDCGSCWAVSSAGAFGDRLCITHGLNTTLVSAQDMTSCCNADNGCSGSSGCDGGFTEDAFGFAASHGLVTGGENPSMGTGKTCYPYALQMCDHHEGGPYTPCPNVCPGGDCNTPNCATSCTDTKYPTPFAKDKKLGKKGYGISGVAAAQTDIMTNGPITASFNVYADFLTYTSGVYTHKTGALLGGHAVRVYGWGTENGVDYWLVANSWNNYWGDYGSFKIKRGVDECGFEDDLTAITV